MENKTPSQQMALALFVAANPAACLTVWQGDVLFNGSLVARFASHSEAMRSLSMARFYAA